MLCRSEVHAFLLTEFDIRDSQPVRVCPRFQKRRIPRLSCARAASVPAPANGPAASLGRPDTQRQSSPSVHSHLGSYILHVLDEPENPPFGERRDPAPSPG